MNTLRSCDHWDGARYCEADTSFTDEVTEESFCHAHAGPLAWPACTVNVYSAALRMAGHYDKALPLPVVSERAA